MVHYLIAIIPSEDITLQIRQIRTSLFKEFGLISSRSLPEIIPVAFINKIIKKDQFQKVTLTKDLNSTTLFHVVGNDIFLKINNIDSINILDNRMSENIISGLFTTLEGFYLGTFEKKSNKKEIIKYLEHENKINLKWKKNSLELVKITTGNTNWWEKIHWETIWKSKLNLS